MARTIQQIFDQISAEQASMSSLSALQPNVDTAQTFLTDVTSTSRVGRLRTLKWVVAYAMHLHERVVEQMLAAKIPPTLLYRKQRCLEWQYGDALVEDNGKWIYNPIVPANRLVQYCSVKQDAASGVVTIKVGKDDGAGNPTPLSTPEFNAFKAFNLIDGTEGTKYSYISSAPDVFKVGYNVYYDPSVMLPTGELINQPGVYPVADAINNYLKGLDFSDSFFVAEQLDSKINGVPGVVPPVTGVVFAQRTLCQAKVGSSPYINIQALSPSIYQPFAGYGRISTGSGETLNDTITYIPNP